MGYSIATRIRTPELKERMFKFLQEEFRDWNDLPGQEAWKPEYLGYRGPLDEGLAFDHGKCTIGFDYSCLNGGPRNYIYSLLNWISLKVGKTRKFRKISETRRIPYLIHDGSESRPILVKRTWPKVPVNFHWAVVDEWGCWDAKDLPVVRTEIQRLDALWLKVEGSSV